MKETEVVEEEFDFAPRMNKDKCVRCMHHMPGSGYIGSCAHQSMGNVNSRLCGDFREKTTI